MLKLPFFVQISFYHTAQKINDTLFVIFKTIVGTFFATCTVTGYPCLNCFCAGGKPKPEVDLDELKKLLEDFGKGDADAKIEKMGDDGGGGGANVC